MPSPVAHTLAGVVAFELLHPRAEDRVTHKSWQLLLPWIILPSLPDIDYFLSYLLYNDPRVLHGGSPTRSVLRFSFPCFWSPGRSLGRHLRRSALLCLCLPHICCWIWLQGKRSAFQAASGSCSFFLFLKSASVFPSFYSLGHAIELFMTGSG